MEVGESSKCRDPCATDQPQTARDPLAIRDLLLGTLVVALALAGCAPSAALDVHDSTSKPEFLVGCLIGLLWLTLIALLGYQAALFSCCA